MNFCENYLNYKKNIFWCTWLHWMSQVQFCFVSAHLDWYVCWNIATVVEHFKLFCCVVDVLLRLAVKLTKLSNVLTTILLTVTTISSPASKTYSKLLKTWLHTTATRSVMETRVNILGIASKATITTRTTAPANMAGKENIAVVNRQNTSVIIQ